MTSPADLIVEYVKLRAGKKVADDTYKKWVAENYTERMDALEMELLDTLNNLGLQNLAGPPGTGTVYKKVSTSVTIQDATEFRRHVIGSEQWDLADWRASKTVIDEMAEKGEPLPPGVKREAFITVGIRKN